MGQELRHFVRRNLVCGWLRRVIDQVSSDVLRQAAPGRGEGKQNAVSPGIAVIRVGAVEQPVVDHDSTSGSDIHRDLPVEIAHGRVSRFKAIRILTVSFGK